MRLASGSRLDAERRVGTAGWALPRGLRSHFDGEGTQLERYARRFGCVEIDSSFYRPHRRSTYERWAASVPDDFRFAIKLSREITHARRFVEVTAPLERFLDETSGLGPKRDVILVQLPPSFAFDRPLAASFFTSLRGRYAGRIACEPRHASWFDDDADALLCDFDVARVAADPPPSVAASRPGGTLAFAYHRLHGSPVVYRSPYNAACLETLAHTLRAFPGAAWCIFDNTTFGAATANALDLAAHFERR